MPELNEIGGVRGVDMKWDEDHSGVTCYSMNDHGGMIANIYRINGFNIGVLSFCDR